MNPGRVDTRWIAEPAPYRGKRGLRAQAVCSPTLVAPAPGTDTQVRLKLLLVTAASDESGFDSMKTFLGRIGVPFDTLIASSDTLCAEKLQTGSLGNYQGIILTTNNLAYFDGTNWASAFRFGGMAATRRI